TTRFAEVRSVLAPAGVLATLGVGTSTAVTATGAHPRLGMQRQLALLLGALISSTDAAPAISVLPLLPLPRRLPSLVAADSGCHGPPAAILVLMFSASPFTVSLGDAVVEIAFELAVGAVIGIGCGFVGAFALRHAALPASGLYPIATFGVGMVA